MHTLPNQGWVEFGSCQNVGPQYMPFIWQFSGQLSLIPSSFGIFGHWRQGLPWDCQSPIGALTPPGWGAADASGVPFGLSGPRLVLAGGLEAGRGGVCPGWEGIGDGQEGSALAGRGFNICQETKGNWVICRALPNRLECTIV